MDKYALLFLAAFLVNCLLTPVFAKLSLAMGIIDHPSRRRFHLSSMPMLGGAAMAASFYAVAWYAGGAPLFREYWGLFAAALIMMCAGLYDDIKGLKPSLKLAMQVGAAGLIMANGIMLRATGFPPLDAVMTVIWVAGIINALNLVDNIDGLSSGTAAIGSCFFALFALLMGKPQVAIIAVIFSGVCMGFLFHNFHPASLFLGDAGSMFVGTLLSGFGLLVARPGDAVTTLAIGVVLGLLIFDTGLVVIMRLSHGFHITDGGKDHTSHRLCTLGLGVQGSVTVLFGVCFIFGVCAIAMLKVPRHQALLIPLILLLIAMTFWFLLKDTYDYSQHKVE